MATITLAADYLERIADSLGVDPDRVTRVVIDLRAGDLAVMYVQGFAQLPPDFDLSDGVHVPGFDDG